jgi:hypothetical protein
VEKLELFARQLKPAVTAIGRHCSTTEPNVSLTAAIRCSGRAPSTTLVARIAFCCPH